MNPVPPQINRGEIALLIGTRARPQYLVEVFQSLQKNTARKDKVSFWLYVDEDDTVTRQVIEAGQFPDPGFAVHWHYGQQTGDIGGMHEVLWRKSGRTAEIFMVSVDDARFDTPGWDEITRQKFSEYSDGVLLAFPHDPMTADTATYPIFGWGWLETLQQIFPGHFPYWFDDRWVNQVGALAGRCVKLPILLYPIRGKGRTKRMRNLPFWTRFFQLTLDERKESARALLAASQTDPVAAEAALEKVAAKLAKELDTFSDIYCVFQEERHTEMTPEERKHFDAKYFKQEALAVGRLISHAGELIAKKQYAEAMVFLDATQLSDLRVRQAHALKAECLRALGRTAEAERIGNECLTTWPEMNNSRRFFRFLGMVANDGKRLLVGLTQKGKKGK
ncbi:MAG: hypothetical protein HY298_15495 [Verrucomicrobia bacterium]|nr:hypothetical protein [Verrucomicrobiota bacterium]